MYDPGTAEGWKAAVAKAIEGQIPSEPLDVPLSVSIRFYFPRPKSHFRTTKKETVLRPDSPAYHIAKPDADNAAKAVLDCLTQIRVWRDDSLVSVLFIQKLYSNHPGANIRISELAD